MNYADIKNPRKHRLLCSLTGSPADDAHHLHHKGAGGRGEKASADHDDATPLARFVHDLHHAAHLDLWRGDDGLLMYRADDKGAAALRRRGVQCHAGQTHNALYEGRTYDDAPDVPLDEATSAVLATATDTFRDLDDDIATMSRRRAVLLHRVKATVPREVFARWVVDDLGVSKSLVSKAITTVDHLGETMGADLPADVAYMAARAVKLGLTSPEQAVAEIRATTLHDFAEAHGLVKPREKREPVLVCAACGCAAPQSEYERQEATR